MIPLWARIAIVGITAAAVGFGCTWWLLARSVRLAIQRINP